MRPIVAVCVCVSVSVSVSVSASASLEERKRGYVWVRPIAAATCRMGRVSQMLGV